MSYNLSINGHKEFETPEEAQAFEEGIEQKARALVGELEGVANASGSFSYLGYKDFLAPPPAAVEQPVEPAAPSETTPPAQP